jgi:hypothetical protein
VPLPAAHTPMRPCLIYISPVIPLEPLVLATNALLFLSYKQYTHGMIDSVSSSSGTVLTSLWLAASNNCALYNLYYLVLFALNAFRNPYFAGCTV